MLVYENATVSGRVEIVREEDFVTVNVSGDELSSSVKFQVLVSSTDPEERYGAMGVLEDNVNAMCEKVWGYNPEFGDILSSWTFKALKKFMAYSGNVLDDMNGEAQVYGSRYGFGLLHKKITAAGEYVEFCLTNDLCVNELKVKSEFTVKEKDLDEDTFLEMVSKFCESLKLGPEEIKDVKREMYTVILCQLGGNC